VIESIRAPAAPAAPGGRAGRPRRPSPRAASEHPLERGAAVDLDALLAELPADGATALLCVEADPEACHRSLIAERLTERHGLPVGHVRPAAAAPVSARR